MLHMKLLQFKLIGKHLVYVAAYVRHELSTCFLIYHNLHALILQSIFLS